MKGGGRVNAEKLDGRTAARSQVPLRSRVSGSPWGRGPRAGTGLERSWGLGRGEGLRGEKAPSARRGALKRGRSSHEGRDPRTERGLSGRRGRRRRVPRRRGTPPPAAGWNRASRGATHQAEVILSPSPGYCRRQQQREDCGKLNPRDSPEPQHPRPLRSAREPRPRSLRCHFSPRTKPGLESIS